MAAQAESRKREKDRTVGERRDAAFLAGKALFTAGRQILKTDGGKAISTARLRSSA
ncbi:hypothetical protein DSM101010T_30960 [Desulfovibrio subterraneus]|uniref:Uncharacterized protein n=1 Tax=Desulfovibrio subterraneus TaxID=2718620 RepID=A0A7J0BN88_9BACT|nr:hypothetical protein DSM101010T_30960 [Desulfovibrio subterraneus]